MGSQIQYPPDIVQRSFNQTKSFEYLYPFIKAHQGDPRNVSYINSITSIMEKLGMFKESIEYLDKLIVLQPKNMEFRLRKIDSLINSGQLNEALSLVMNSHGCL